MGRTNRWPRRSSDAGWYGTAPAQQWLIDTAAGRAHEHRFLDAQDLAHASDHGLLGLLAANSGLSSALLDASYARMRARQAVMEWQLRDVLERFAEEGLKVAVLKGPYLSHEHYAVPAHRTFTDVDLLVPSSQIERSTRVLGELRSIGQTLPEKRPTTDKRDIPVYDLARGVSFNIDLHWDMFSYAQLRGYAAGATGAAWDAAAWCEDHALGPLWQLPVTAEAAFLCAHAWLDHRFRLILFRDIAELTAGPDFDWNGFVSYAERWKLRSVCYASLLIANRLLEASVPEEVLTRLRVPCSATRVIEAALPRIDFVEFDGHKAHPLNLAAVTIHDDPATRRAILRAAPLSVPNWRRRVSREHQQSEALTRERSLLIVMPANGVVSGCRPPELTAELAALGWDARLVTLPSSQRGGDMAGRISRERLVFAVRRELARARTDAILAIGPAALHGILKAAGRGLPLLVYESDRDFHKLDARDLARLRSQLERVDAVLVPSDDIRDKLVNEVRISPERVHTAGDYGPTMESSSPVHVSSRWHDVIMKGLLGTRSPHQAGDS